jgi:hypothetical protein
VPIGSADAISSYIDNNCKEFGKEANLTIKNVIEDVANDAVNILKSEGSYKGSKYRKGFTAVQNNQYGLYGYGWTIGNKKYYMLTHLLEDGHDIKNQYTKGRSLGKTRSFPHFEPAGEKIEKLLEDKTIEALNELSKKYK